MTNYRDDALDYAKQMSPAGRQYLNGRGLTDATIDAFMLGEVVVPASASHTRFVGSICIPYLNPDGSVRSLRFRYLSGQQKYDNMKGHNVSLYNVAHTTASRVWVCEGEFDSLILTQMGYPAVAVPGASSFKDEWKYLFVYADEVSLVFDGDEAGRKGAGRLQAYLGPVVDNLRVLTLPPKTDVTDLYLKDPKQLEALVA